MKTVKQYAILISSIVFLLLSGCGGNSTSSMVNEGDNPMNDPNDPDPEPSGEAAPDFSYTALGGMDFTLSDHKGEVVYIFFFGANCPHCRDNGPVTESKIYQKFLGKANFVAVGLDTWNTSASEVDAFKNVTGITYPLLLNARQSLVDYYGNTSAYDRSVVIDAEGKIAYMGTGFVNSDADKVAEVIEEELGKIE